jgi:hypothetical protein
MLTGKLLSETIRIERNNMKKQISATISTKGKLDKNVIVKIDNHDDFEEAGNDPFSWISSAEDLLISSNILRKNYERASAKMRKHSKGSVPDEFNCLSVALMLKGMAIENLLKAVYLKKNKMVKNGKFCPPSEFNNHSLVSMAIYNNITLTDDERDALENLSSAITFYGRFPIPKSSDRWRQKIEGCEGVQPKSSWSENNDIATKKVLKAIELVLNA